MQILGYTSKAMDLYIGTGLRILEHSKNNTYAEFVFSVIISQILWKTLSGGLISMNPVREYHDFTRSHLLSDSDSRTGFKKINPLQEMFWRYQTFTSYECMYLNIYNIYFSPFEK